METLQERTLKSEMAAKMRGDGNDEKEEAVYGDSVTSAEVESCEAHHVLAVDDCVIDRMVIKRLLRTDSVKGLCYLFRSLEIYAFVE